MGVERVDYYSEEEYEQALCAKAQQAQEPDVVPRFKCGCQMYEITPNSEENICSECKIKTRRSIMAMLHETKFFLLNQYSIRATQIDDDDYIIEFASPQPNMPDIEMKIKE